MVTNQDGVPSEKELLNALEEKYDALKDKLIAESLMNDLGAAEWGRLSERERQAKIMKIRLQEKKLRQEGKFDEANRFVKCLLLLLTIMVNYSFALTARRVPHSDEEKRLA